MSDFASDVIPTEGIDLVCAEIKPRLDDMVRKLCDDAYEHIMVSVQEYLRENAEYNIKSRFDAQQRDVITGYSALKAVESSETLSEAKANAYAARKGYWSEAQSLEYKETAKHGEVLA